MTNDSTFSRRALLTAAGAAAASAAMGCRLAAHRDAASAAPAAQVPQRRPNVVFILSDDHRRDTMSCAGNTILHTPHLDRLAREGCLFSNSFCCSGVCSPSRASFLSGRHAHQAAAPEIIWCNNSFLMGQRMFPALLHEAGYRTGYVGKFHLGESERGKPGFDYWAGFPWLGDYRDPAIWIDGHETQFSGHADDILAGLAADYITAQAHADEPFCLVLGLKAPHIPFGYAARHEPAFADVDFPKPASYQEPLEQTKPALARNMMRIEQADCGVRAFSGWQNYIRSYYRSVLGIDDAVGRVLAALDAAGVAEDTLVIYSSDQGYHLGEHGLTEKHFPYEHVLRIPLLVRYPRLIAPGLQTEALALSIDVAPTVLDLCTGQVPASMTGRSWRPLFAPPAAGTDEPPPAWREDFLFEFWNHTTWELPSTLAVRTARYKLIEYQFLDFRELYDLQADPGETTNLLAADPRHPALAEMEQRLARLKQETGWHKRQWLPVPAVQCLGPIAPADFEAARKALLGRHAIDPAQQVAAGERRYAWQRCESDAQGVLALPGADAEASPTAAARGTYFVAFNVERQTDYDPGAWLQVVNLLEGRELELPCAAYHRGQCVWENPLHVRAMGNTDGSTFNVTCNPPLLSAADTVLLHVMPPATQPLRLRLRLNAPGQVVRLGTL